MNGIIVVNKPSGYTSRDVVNILCKKFNTKKVGHTGTLDPLATGVLVICFGRYTKLVSKITNLEKEYIATVKLGIKTDTLDITGNIEETRNCSVDKSVLINTLNSFIGTYNQEAPIYSAIKVNGKKLYEYARKNKKIDLPKREVTIKNIELIDYKENEFIFKTTVSKGTYIRSLIKDICDKLAVIGCMKNLIRTKQGEFTIENTYTLQDIKSDNYKLLTVKDVFNYKQYELKDTEYFKVKNGNKLKINSNEEFLILTKDNKEIAIYQKEDELYKSYFRCE